MSLTTLIRLGAGAFLILGVICAALFGLSPWLARLRLPVTDLSSVAIDADGHVYCALVFYSRVQVYDSDGRFLTSWYVPSGRGDFRIRTNAKDQIEVVTARGAMFYVFDKKGQLLTSESGVKGRFDEFDKVLVGQVHHDTLGNSYTVVGYGWITARVIKSMPNGVSATIVSCWPFGTLFGPVGGFSYWFLGIVFLIILRTAFRSAT